MPTTRTESAVRGYSASKEELMTRLARVEGQIRGIAGMVEDERYCIDIVTQINAARAALDKIALGLLDDHVRHCLGEGSDGSADADELMGAVGRLLSR
jgi:CsoR family transcriptional regulator, copper-sensing transcriptional repressor